MPPCRNRRRLVCHGLFVALLALNLAARVMAADGALGIVSGSPGKIMAGDKVLAEVPRGTMLWIFSAKPGWAEVKVPDREEHGWLADKEIQEEVWTAAQRELLVQAAPLYKRYSQERQANQLAAARATLEAGLKIERQALAAGHPNLAETLNYLGQVCVELHDYAAAQKHYAEALAIRTTIFGREHLDTATTVNAQGVLEISRGDYATALKHYEEAATIMRRIAGPNHPDLVAMHTNLGNIYFRLGKNAESRKAFDQALELSLRINGLQNLDTASVYNNVAVLLTDEANYAEARAALEQALAIRRKTLPETDSLVSQTLTNLGILYHKQGDLQAARKIFESILAGTRKTQGPTSPETAQALNNLALVLSALEDHAGARKALEESLAIYRQLLGADHPDNASMLMNLGATLRDLQELDAARRAFDESLAIRLKHLGQDHPLTADVRSNLAELLYKTKDYAGSKKLYTEVLSSYRKTYGEEHPTVGAMYSAIAWTEQAEKNYDQARELWDKSIRMLRRHSQRTLPALSAAEQLNFLERRYHPGWVESLAFGWQQRENPAVVNTAIDWLINGKAIAQESLAAQQLLARDARNPQLAALVAELTSVRQRLASQALVTPEPKDAEQHQAALGELAADEQRLARALAQATGQSTNRDRWIELAALRQALPAGSVYIDLVRMGIEDFKSDKVSEPHYLAWIVPADSQGKVLILDLGDAALIDRAVEQARTALASAAAKDGALRTEGEAAAAAQTNKQLQAAADLVLGPLLPHLTDTKQVILSPDGALWLLPWAALPVSKEQCLLERYSVRYVLSGRDLLKHESAAKVTPGAPAIFVNPDFDLQPAKTAPGKANTTRGFSRNSSLPRVAPLPFTAFEGQAARPILEKLSGTAPQTFEQAQAAEAAAKNLRRPRQLLFATHGFFLDTKSEPTHGTRAASTNEASSGENPLLRCGLLLAGCNVARAAGAEDGVLTGMEIVGLDLRGTELVVLSACETGIGKVRNGEGVAGLRQAFQLAGAQSVVSTLWQVPDRDSAIIMQDFFTNLAAGQSKADALRHAQLKRIAARKEKSGAAHPFFWAAWTVTGE